MTTHHPSKTLVQEQAQHRNHPPLTWSTHATFRTCINATVKSNRRRSRSCPVFWIDSHSRNNSWAWWDWRRAKYCHSCKASRRWWWAGLLKSSNIKRHHWGSPAVSSIWQMSSRRRSGRNLLSNWWWDGIRGKVWVSTVCRVSQGYSNRLKKAPSPND